MVRDVVTLLMFQGAAEEAMDFYVSLFPDAAVLGLERYGPEGSDGPAAEGQVKEARFTLCGREYRCFDTPIGHSFDFTPSSSLLLECDSEDELDQLYGALSQGGTVLLKLGDYGYSRRFAWVTDRFGVSWRLNLL